jgi:hypothetical protein
MNQLETVVTCPFGHKCIEVKDNKIHRCMLLMEIRGQNPNTGEESTENKCAFVWQVMMQMDTTRKVDGVQQATESFRNEMVKNNQQSQVLMTSALSQVYQQHLLKDNS